MAKEFEGAFKECPPVAIGQRSPSDLPWAGSVEDGWSTTVGSLKFLIDVHPTDTQTYRYVVSVDNQSGEPVELPDVRLLDLRAAIPDGARPAARYMTGSWHFDACYPPRAFRVIERTFMTEDHAKPIVIGGANAGTYSPLIQVAIRKQGELSGVFAAFEWSAGWELWAGWTEPSFRGEPRSTFQLRGGTSTGVVQLAPGETVDLPAVHIGFFHVSDWPEADDLIRSHIGSTTPHPNDQRPARPVAYNTWFGTAETFDSAYLLEQAAAAADIGCEYFCLDAAWYAGGRTFFDGIGNWHTPDPDKFGDDGEGLDDLRRTVRRLGMRFGIWLVPQLARPGTDAFNANPGHFRQGTSTSSRLEYERRYGSLHEDFPEMEEGSLFALEDQGARNALLETMRDVVTRWDVDWIRVESVPVDGLAYNEGYDFVLDSLASEFPNLFLELCNGGGQRLDLGAVRRHHGNWLSDHTSDPHVVRTMQSGALRYWPPEYLNMAVVSQRHSPLVPSELDLLSRMIGSLSFSGDIAAWTESDRNLAKEHVAIFKALRGIRGRVRFPLHQPENLDEWEIVWIQEDQGTELLYAFRIHGPRSIELEIPPEGWTLVTGSEDTTATASDNKLVLTVPEDGAGLWSRGADHLLRGIQA